MKRLLSKSAITGSPKGAAARAAFGRGRQGGEKSALARIATGIVQCRFFIACAAVFALAAVVLGIVLSNGSTVGAAEAEGRYIVDVDAIAPVSEPPRSMAFDGELVADPFMTDEPTALPTPNVDRMHVIMDPIITNPPLPPVVTVEPYIEVVTEVPDLIPERVVGDNAILVRFGEHNDLVPAVQERLMILWYMDQDEPTDYLGRATTNALEVFQRRNDIPVTGRLNTRTYNALFSINARAYLCSLGDTGSDVEYFRERLYELGYLDEKTGDFDEAMLDAVKAFQEANELIADGKVGRSTKEALYDEDAVARMWAKGDSGEKVLAYQQRLQELGYLTTEPDGNYGKDTEMAVRRFQAKNELVVDGYLGPTTCEKLMSEDAAGNALCYSMYGSDVLNVQTRLYELNYMRAQDVNSYFTSLTEEAVKLFQKNNHLTEDGRVGKFTMNVLMSDTAVRAKAPVVPATPSSNNGSGGSGNSNSGGNNSGGNNSGGGNSGGGNSGGGNSGGTVSARINNFISIARSKLGCRYVRGGKGPSVFDCSGFVYWCLNRAGVSQSYMTSYMWRSCKRYPRNNSIYNVKKGDVIVYYGHVAICSGSWTQIDASQSNGKVVERTFNKSYWYKNFICSFHIFT